MKYVVVLLSLLSAGCSAQSVSTCESLVQPIAISKEEMLGRWHYIAGSTDFPVSRSLGHLMNSALVDISTTSQSNVLEFVQINRILDGCSKRMYNMTFEKSALSAEEPTKLKEVYLPTNCSDCLVIHEEMYTRDAKLTSLLLFSRRQNASADALEALKRQAECLQLHLPLTMNQNNGTCSDGIMSEGGLGSLNPVLESTGHNVLRLLETFFDMSD